MYTRGAHGFPITRSAPNVETGCVCCANGDVEAVGPAWCVRHLKRYSAFQVSHAPHWPDRFPISICATYTASHHSRHNVRYVNIRELLLCTLASSVSAVGIVPEPINIQTFGHKINCDYRLFKEDHGCHKKRANYFKIVLDDDRHPSLLASCDLSTCARKEQHLRCNELRQPVISTRSIPYSYVWPCKLAHTFWTCSLGQGGVPLHETSAKACVHLR